MHVSTLKDIIHLCSPPSSLVVTMNSSTCMSSYVFRAIFELHLQQIPLLSCPEP
jgi:hypothetical protein